MFFVVSTYENIRVIDNHHLSTILLLILILPYLLFDLLQFLLCFLRLFDGLSLPRLHFRRCRGCLRMVDFKNSSKLNKKKLKKQFSRKNNITSI